MNTRDWRNAAACRETDPEIFFPVGDGPAAQQQTDDAKAICYRCPVLDTCLRWALDNRQDVGIWGGLTEAERRRLHRRKARSGKPQEVQAAALPVVQAVTPRSLASVLAEGAIDSIDGHVLWTGSHRIVVDGKHFTPGRLAWVVAHGTNPAGHVLVECDQAGCVAAAHLADTSARAQRHGTEASWKAHKRRGDEPCEECKAGRRTHDLARRQARREKTTPERSAA